MGATSNFASLQSEIGRVSSGLTALNGAAGPLEASVKNLSKTVEEHVRVEGTIVSSLGHVDTLIPSLAANIQFLSQLLGTMHNSVEPLGEQFSGALSRATQSLTALVHEADGATPVLARLTSAATPASESLSSIISPLTDTRDSLTQLRRALASTVEQTRNLHNAVVQLQSTAPAGLARPS